MDVDQVKRQQYPFELSPRFLVTGCWSIFTTDLFFIINYKVISPALIDLFVESCWMIIACQSERFILFFEC
ncbi:MAG: hypothetical protein ACLFSM_06720 [Thermoplasmata archaeon]